MSQSHDTIPLSAGPRSDPRRHPYHQQPGKCHFIAEHSETNIVVVEDAVQLDKFATRWSRLPNLKAIVIFNRSVADEGWVF